MSTELYKANDEIMNVLQTLIKDNHPDLISLIPEIAVVFREKHAKQGGKPIITSVKKPSPMVEVLGEKKYYFVIEVAQDLWLELSPKQQEAALDHALCACRAEEDQNTGEVKTTIAPPDIAMYRDNARRYGVWMPIFEDEGLKAEEDEVAKALDEAVQKFRPNK